VPLKFKIAVFINLLVVPLLLILSLLFYSQFRNAIDERVFLQLASIKQLKKVQIEEYLSETWHSLQTSEGDTITRENQDLLIISDQYQPSEEILTALMEQTESGIYDLSHLSTDGAILLGFLDDLDSSPQRVLLTRAPKIQQILLERTGMGETGETYLVGEDSFLRSRSRFYIGKAPLDIKASPSTKFEETAIEGSGIVQDYREKAVYSVFGTISLRGLHWMIRSEVDQQEALQPLSKMKMRLIFISLGVIFFTILSSLQLAHYLVAPVVRMKDLLLEMADGNFKIKVHRPNAGGEIKDMFVALERHLTSVNQAMDFANSIGALELDREYTLQSEKDTLGKSLIRMRDKLKAFNDLEEQNQFIKQRAMVQGQENERHRLSQELHDGLGPLLTALKLMIQKLNLPASHKSKVKATLDETIAEVRRMSYNLMPPTLIDFGVGYALEKLITMIGKASPIEIRFDNQMLPESKAPLNIHIGLYRMAQEAINNVVKHTKATTIKFSLTEFENKICFFFTDDGCGFDTNISHDGSGLLNIKERCRILHGSFNIQSDENGTTIEIEIPTTND